MARIPGRPGVTLSSIGNSKFLSGGHASMADATQPEQAHLSVPGATLYYRTRGSGPLLLMLQGGDGDADGTDALTDHLVNGYTVLSYDRRGLSRSPITTRPRQWTSPPTAR